MMTAQSPSRQETSMTIGPRVPSAAALLLLLVAAGVAACAPDDDAADRAAGGNAAEGPATGIGAPPGAEDRRPGMRVTGRFIDLDGTEIGEVTLEEGADGVLIRGSVSGLGAGPHGVHFHEVGRCEPPFESAGAHFNPGGREHGLTNPAGPHDGDLPNIIADASGVAEFELFSAFITLGAGAQQLLDADGTALVVHAEADDHSTDPSGDSGARIACAVLARQ
jgi:superoxide dismutase, Cu-Zn family